MILILVGLVIFSFGLFNYYKVRILSFSGEIERVEVGQKDLPVRIIIPSVDIDLKVDPAEIKDGVWDISYQNATYLVSSEAPGRVGNTVIYGHNKKLVFGNLPYLSLGQKIVVVTQSGEEYEYEVYQKDFVAPTRVDLVSPTAYEELTLFTCWGLLDTQRVVVKAKRLK